MAEPKVIKFVLRIPEKFHNKLKRFSKNDDSSVNRSLIVALKRVKMDTPEMLVKVSHDNDVDEKFVLRIPEKQHRAVKKAAKKYNTSMNNMILRVMRQRMATYKPC